MDSPLLHYHIHWSGRADLDWECFGTAVDAERNAKEWVRPGETYTIEEHGAECPRCGDRLKVKSAHAGGDSSSTKA
jgi:hypothetical protein